MRFHEKIKLERETETQGVHEFVLHSGLKFQLYTVRIIDSKKQQHDSSGNTHNSHVNQLVCEQTTPLGG